MNTLITLNEKASALLELANDMQRRIDMMNSTNEQYPDTFFGRVYSDEKIDTCERGKKRLIESYKRVLTQIIEQI